MDTSDSLLFKGCNSNLPIRADPIPVTVSISGRFSNEEIQTHGKRNWVLNTRLPPGRYQLAVWFDAAEFDWESIYLESTGNQSRRSGPWDFDLVNVHPLVPAWRVTKDSLYLGLAAVRRPTAEDVLQKRMVLRIIFDHKEDGAIHLELTPYNEFQLKAVQICLDESLEERLLPTLMARLTAAPRDLNYGAWRSETDYFLNLAKKQADLDPLYQAALNNALAAVRNTTSNQPCILNPENLVLLAYAWRTQRDEGALEMARKGIDYFLSLPAWGSPDPDAYGHNCDMAVASLLECLSFAWHDFGEALDDGRGSRSAALKDRLVQQMRIFLRLALLQTDYWGGSLRQDHGHRSLCRFGTAAINLLGHCEEAPLWVEFVVSRMRRVFALFKSDGGIPVTSHQKIGLYMNDIVTWRDAWRFVSGEDLFQSELFPKIVRFVYNRLDLPSKEYEEVSARGDRKNFFTGWSFFNSIAEIHDCPEAETLTRILLERYTAGPIPVSASMSLLCAIDHARSGPIPRIPFRPQEWDIRPKLGMIGYRPIDTRVSVQIQCLSCCSTGDLSLTTNPCDYGIYVPLEGHFALHVNGKALLLTAEGGYRMRCNLGCSLRIDGKGGYGDLDFTMAVPIMRPDAHFIETAHYDSVTGQAYVRLNLTGLYPDADLYHYVREFHLDRRGLRFRDILSAPKPHRYSWNFPTYRKREISSIRENQWEIKDGSDAVLIAGNCLTSSLSSQKTGLDVVWAYTNENNDEPFDAVEFTTADPSNRLSAEFSVSWDSCSHDQQS